jgi:hypothetical protein
MPVGYVPPDPVLKAPASSALARRHWACRTASPANDNDWHAMRPAARACLRLARYYFKNTSFSCIAKFISGLHIALCTARIKQKETFCQLIAARFGSQCNRQCESGPTPAEKKMVEELNRKRVLNFLDEFYAGDIEGALARCSDDVDFIANAPVDILPHMGHRRGKDELRQMLKIVHSRYSSLRYEAQIIVANGDKVAVCLRAFFRKRRNDRIVQFDVAVFYTLRNGRIVQVREVIDTFDLVQQVLERDVAAVLAATRHSAV